MMSMNIIIIIAIIILFIVIPVLRTLVLRKAAAPASGNSSGHSTVSDESLKRFSELIRMKTVTYNDFSRIDLDTHRKIEDFFKTNYPEVSSKLGMKKLNDFAYIFKWEGRNPEKKPALLMAHFDVVPAQEEGWDFPPFCGDIAGGEIRGRGTIDTKSSLAGILEAADRLLKEGYTPESTVYFAFGGDEEIMGQRGAVEIVKYFKEKGVSFSWVLDEGSVIAEGMLSLTEKPLALIGIAEKGFANVRLKASASPGHASMPPDHTASGLVARAVYRLERNPFPVKLTTTVKKFLRSLVPHVNFPLAVIFSNLWLFSPLIRAIFKKSPTTAAMVRTTQAATVLSGSSKDNVLPDRAEAIVNVRIIPGDTKSGVISRMEKVVNDPSVEVAFTDDKDASGPVNESETDTEGYRAITEATAKIYPDAVPVPFLVTATTDSRHYKDITDNIYRFVPMVLNKDDINKIHGYNESISVANFGRIIGFFTELIKTV